jgi:hypothetical protein
MTKVRQIQWPQTTSTILKSVIIADFHFSIPTDCKEHHVLLVLVTTQDEEP